MAFGLGMMLSLANYAIEAEGVAKGHADAVARDEGNIRRAQATVKRNNQLAERNFAIIGEEELAVRVANGLDAFEIAKEIRKNKASALAQRGGSGSLSSASLQATLTDVQRTGSEALHRHDLNFGAKLRNVSIEKQNITINTQGLNAQAYNQISLSSSDSATGLKLAGIGLKAFEDLGFTRSTKSGKIIPQIGEEDDN